MYCWKDGDNYATTDQTANPNHVGFVGAVNSNTMTIYEGNKGEAVATRTVPINGRYIRGYCLPDYASKATTIKTEAEEDDDMDISKLTDADIEALLPGWTLCSPKRSRLTGLRRPGLGRGSKHHLRRSGREQEIQEASHPRGTGADPLQHRESVLNRSGPRSPMRGRGSFPVSLQTPFWFPPQSPSAV